MATPKATEVKAGQGDLNKEVYPKGLGGEATVRPMYSPTESGQDGVHPDSGTGPASKGKETAAHI